MNWLTRLRQLALGRALDPMSADTRRHIVLVALLAWVGLGADGLSSSCYGPEEAFLALGAHAHLGLYLALMTALTVFVIALAYNQVIELFPSGGGGYKAASLLIGPYAGLVSGAALIVDYVLTIAISVASAGDALFSLLGVPAQAYKFSAELAMVALLLGLNLRGMKESIQVLLPIFLGFFVLHLGLITYGVAYHAPRWPQLLPATLADTRALARHAGWLFTVSLLLRAYSLGGGTYTGIEAVSNNVNVLAEPRARTGKLTMLYMAASLAFTAGGIILLYLLWQVTPQPGQTLNAVVFGKIIGSLGLGDPWLRHALLALVLASEGGLLLVAANTGFLGGPAVLANLAVDRWAPRQFRQLSNRMVTQNGVIVMGIAALLILLWSHGEVSLLVVLYSINVFLTFSLTLFGLCKHWWRQRRFAVPWRPRLLLAACGLLLTGFILLVTMVEKFADGGWLTLAVTGAVIAAGLAIHRHYGHTRRLMARIDDAYSLKMDWDEAAEGPPVDPSKPTAVLLIGANRGAGMHTLRWVLKMFPDRFANFLFVSVGEVDKQSFDGTRTLASLRTKIENSLHYFTSYCANRGLASRAYAGYDADPQAELLRIARQVGAEFGDCVFFAGTLAFSEDNLLTRMLHNQLPLAVQRSLLADGRQMIIVPIPLPEEAPRHGPRDASHIR
ncbi:MAG: APC family permease [Gammaproteobacteria bacterium]|nr:APC family permease [Gammaproteobacteria bacterium]